MNAAGRIALAAAALGAAAALHNLHGRITYLSDAFDLAVADLGDTDLEQWHRIATLARALHDAADVRRGPSALTRRRSDPCPEVVRQGTGW